MENYVGKGNIFFYNQQGTKYQKELQKTFQAVEFGARISLKTSLSYFVEVERAGKNFGLPMCFHIIGQIPAGTMIEGR